MTTVGRNDPCPCGSGKKLKKCCLLRESTAAPAFTAAERQSAIDRLMAFWDRRDLDEEHEAALDIFWEDYQHFWLDYVALRPFPEIVTAEGDPMVFSTVVFDVLDAAAAPTALRAAPGLDAREPGLFEWTERHAEGDSRRSLGPIALRGDRLTLETISRPRADRGRGMLEALLGVAARDQATSYEDVIESTRRRDRQRR